MKYSKEWLCEEEIDQLFSFHEINSRDLLLMRVIYFGALRISEALNSKREHYNIEGDDYAYLTLYEQKTDKKNWEIQPIPAMIYGEIDRFCNDNKIRTQDYVFRTQMSEQMSYNRAYQIVKEWVKKAGIDKEITTHSFRRSRATHMLDAGMELMDVSRFLRHDDIVTTLKYLKISKKRLNKKMNKVDKHVLSKKINIWGFKITPLRNKHHFRF